MYIIETLLSQSLKKKNPLLDLQGSDRRVLQIACQDLMNFLKVHWKLMHEKDAERKVINRIYEFFDENPEELEEFLNLWSGIWIKKWGERVRLLIGKTDRQRWRKVSSLMKDAEPLWIQLQNREEMEDVVIESLIKKGEICGTSILAENLVKMELGSCARKHIRVCGREQMFYVLNNTLRKVREVSRSKGPLIFVRIDKRYFTM